MNGLDTIVGGSNIRHTLGPWVASSHYIVTGPDGYAIAEVYGDAHITADHKLIAAAPDLVEALRSLTNGFKYSAEVCEIARAALAKAGL